MRRPNRNFNIPPPPGESPGIWTFEDWIVQIPAPSGQKFQMPYPIVGLVSQMPLLKNNRRPFLSSVIKLVYIRGTRRQKFKMESYFGRWLRGTRYPLRTRNTYWLVSRLRRMLFEWQDILQLISQSGFFIRQCFFFLSLFTTVLWLI